MPFVTLLVRNRGSFARANDAAARQSAARPTAEIVRILREHADSRFTPPGGHSRDTPDRVLVHSGDIRRPLACRTILPAERVQAALTFLTSGRTFGFVPRGLLRDIRLTATDLDVDAGTGAQLTGRGADLMMAACARPSALPLLAGPGVEVLRGRLT